MSAPQSQVAQTKVGNDQSLVVFSHLSTRHTTSPPSPDDKAPSPPLPSAYDIPSSALEEGGGLVNSDGRVWYMVSAPLERDASAVKEIVVATESKDQGWSSFPENHGTYDVTSSWFDLTLLRDGKEVPNTRLDVQHNVHAGKEFKLHTNTIPSTHPFVKEMQKGDCITLWARALYPKWENHVQRASIAISYDVLAEDSKDEE
ncbi:hypothetical protein B9479_006800 [Cryptococcus floricola]|uniref:Uncharacterized protein n=1 Tax=Cryptococcus floricola TaxID=2591691 RepID=A0A5D3AP48_9TREE|nr:hypothetical protein B9479_006800 [Cryptococcus floricola]